MSWWGSECFRCVTHKENEHESQIDFPAGRKCIGRSVGHCTDATKACGGAGEDFRWCGQDRHTYRSVGSVRRSFRLRLDHGGTHGDRRFSGARKACLQNRAGIGRPSEQGRCRVEQGARMVRARQRGHDR